MNYKIMMATETKKLENEFLNIQTSGSIAVIDALITEEVTTVFGYPGGAIMPIYDALFDYYLASGEMPYGVAKARTGDPENWITGKFEQDLPEHVAEGEYTTHAMNSGPKSMQPNAALASQVANKPVQNPTAWGTDPITAATDIPTLITASTVVWAKDPIEAAKEIGRAHV